MAYEEFSGAGFFDNHSAQSTAAQYFGSDYPAFGIDGYTIGKGAARINPDLPFIVHIVKSREKMYIYPILGNDKKQFVFSMVF